MQQIAVIRYGEIALKGKNRQRFLRQLTANISSKLHDLAVKVEPRYGRVMLNIEEGVDRAEVTRRLERVFGIENFSFGLVVDRDIECIEKGVLHLLGELKGWTTFKIIAKRTNKSFPVTSDNINRRIGGLVLDKIDGAKVDVRSPDAPVHIEIDDRSVYITAGKLPGPGGLPVGVSGRVLCLVSGGIDSPVAAWRMMRRGCSVDFVHYHSMPYTDRASVENVRELVRILSDWQREATLTLIPLADIQKQIVTNTDSKYRVLLYRRFMFRMAEQLAKQARIKALVTGESVGQVASQTIDNMGSVHLPIELPILQPLVGMDKSEIMSTAKHIGTYETSILPHSDCCSLFTPRHPATRTSAYVLDREEEQLRIGELVESALARKEEVIE